MIKPLVTQAYFGRAMAQAISRRPLIAQALVCALVSLYGIFVGKSGTGQDFLRVPRFSLVSVIPPWNSILIYHLRDER